MTNTNQHKPTQKAPQKTEEAPKEAPPKPERVNVKIRTFPGKNGKEVAVVGGIYLWDPQEYFTSSNGQPISQSRAPKLAPGQVVSVPKEVANVWMRDPELRRKLEITFEDATRPVVFDTAQEAMAMMPGKRFGRSAEGKELKKLIAEKLAAGKYPDWPTEDNPNTVTGMRPSAQPVTGWADSQRR